MMNAEDASTGTLQASTGPRIEPRLAGHTGYLAHLAWLRAERCGRAMLPTSRDTRDLAVLSVLSEGPLSQARLGILLEVNRTVMISVIDRLEAAKLARRERDPADRRRYALRITLDGRNTLTQMQESVRDAEQTLAAPLTRVGHQRLDELLRRIVPDLTGTLPESLTTRTGFLLDSVSRRLRGRREQAMRDLGLEPRCVRMLVPLDSTQPCTQEQLASCIGVTSPTIMQAIDELHASALITRDRNPADRREHVLRLTSDGESYLAQALQAEAKAQRDLTGLLGVAETAELNELLAAIIVG